MNILVRLPNWLGDMVMSMYFVRALRQQYPNARITVIVKKGLEGLLPSFHDINDHFIFSKEGYKGLRGLYRFGRMIKSQQQYDLFFSLPDSFSSAFMGWASGATHRVGYRNEGRNFLLTHSAVKDASLHRVEQYVALISLYNGQTIALEKLQMIAAAPKSIIIINIHSEAQSRRLPKDKAVALINDICDATDSPIILIGAPKDAALTNEVISQLNKPDRVTSVAGKTSLQELQLLCSTAAVVLSTDSGPAHLANAAGAPLVVLFGAGNEKETGPFYQAPAEVIRLGKLSCEPCRSNDCKFKIDPPCLTDLDNARIVAALKQFLL